MIDQYSSLSLSSPISTLMSNALGKLVMIWVVVLGMQEIVSWQRDELKRQQLRNGEICKRVICCNTWLRQGVTTVIIPVSQMMNPERNQSKGEDERDDFLIESEFVSLGQ
jgi:hypothetical protein